MDKTVRQRITVYQMQLTTYLMQLTTANHGKDNSADETGLQTFQNLER
jgi:hypothetical protein